MKCSENMTPIPMLARMNGVRNPNLGQKAMSERSDPTAEIQQAAGIMRGQCVYHGRSMRAT